MFAPNSTLRAAVTPAGRGRDARDQEPATGPAVSPATAMTWRQRLKRVFAIAIDTCRRCGGTLRVIASLEDTALSARILAQLEQRSAESPAQAPFAARAPPPSSLA